MLSANNLPSLFGFCRPTRANQSTPLVLEASWQVADILSPLHWWKESHVTVDGVSLCSNRLQMLLFLTGYDSDWQNIKSVRLDDGHKHLSRSEIQSVSHERNKAEESQLNHENL